MNEKTAWDKFTLTGSVADYLQYASLKQDFNNKKEVVEQNNANQYQWDNNQRASYF